jgi:hypothetical protein
VVAEPQPRKREGCEGYGKVRLGSRDAKYKAMNVCETVVIAAGVYGLCGTAGLAVHSVRAPTLHSH